MKWIVWAITLVLMAGSSVSVYQGDIDWAILFVVQALLLRSIFNED